MLELLLQDLKDIIDTIIHFSPFIALSCLPNIFWIKFLDRKFTGEGFGLFGLPFFAISKIINNIYK